MTRSGLAHRIRIVDAPCARYNALVCRGLSRVRLPKT